MHPALPNEATVRHGAAVALGLVLLGGLGCDHKAPIRKPTRPAVKREAGLPLSSEVTAPGIVEPWDEEVRLAAKESGWIARIAVREGQRVRAGELLALLDDGAQRAAAEASRANLGESQALLERSRRGLTAEEVEQALADRSAAEARSRRAAADALRLAALAGQGIVSRVDAENARHEADAASALAASAAARHAAAARGSREEDIAAAARRVDSARARLRDAAEALARREVRAPVDGTVLWSRYHPGEYYAEGAQALFVLGDVRRLQVRADVDEIDAQRVQAGAPATVRFAAAGIVREGRVLSSSPRMGRKNLLVETPSSRNDTRIREVLIEVPADPALLPGLRVWVTFPASAKG